MNIINEIGRRKKMKWSKVKIKRFHNTLSFWNYASKEEISSKLYWEFFKLICKEKNYCTFCSIFMVNTESDNRGDCVYCPLYREKGIDSLYGPCVYPAYEKWSKSSFNYRKIKYAREIRDAIKTWMINENIYDESLLVEKE